MTSNIGTLNLNFKQPKSNTTGNIEQKSSRSWSQETQFGLKHLLIAGLKELFLGNTIPQIATG